VTGIGGGIGFIVIADVVEAVVPGAGGFDEDELAVEVEDAVVELVLDAGIVISFMEEAVEKGCAVSCGLEGPIRSFSSSGSKPLIL